MSDEKRISTASLLVAFLVVAAFFALVGWCVGIVGIEHDCKVLNHFRDGPQVYECKFVGQP